MTSNNKKFNAAKRDGLSDLTPILEDIRQGRIGNDVDVLASRLHDIPRLNFHHTPNSIATLMSGLINLSEPGKVVDMTTGLSNALARCKATARIGFEIDPGISEISRFLNPDLDIRTQDSLTLQENEEHEAILLTIPWPVRANGCEGQIEAFVDKSIRLLKQGGILVTYVPSTMLTSRKLFNLRKSLGSTCGILAIVEVHEQDNYLLNGAVVLAQKGRRKERIFMGLLSKDPLGLLNLFMEGVGEFWVPSKELNPVRWDRDYYEPDKREYRNAIDRIESRELSELAEVYRGVQFSLINRIASGPNSCLVVGARNLDTSGLHHNEQSIFTAINSVREKLVLREGDILVSSMPHRPIIHTYNSADPQAVLGYPLLLIRSKNGEYIKSYLATEQGQTHLRTMIEMESKGVITPMIPLSRFKKIPIPILPIKDLNLVSDLFLNQASKADLLVVRRELEQAGGKLSVKGNSKVEESLTAYSTPKDSNQKSHALFLEFENSALGKWFIDRFGKVEEQLKNIELKVERILELVQDLGSEFARQKNLPREEEVILSRLERALDDFEKKLDTQSKSLSMHIDEVRDWFNHWEALEEMSRHFIPSAEFLFDEISRLENGDYSPFVVQYCRALENELLSKLFKSFHGDLLKQMTITEISEFLESDLGNNKTSQFAKAVLDGEAKYTLGAMAHLLNFLKPHGKTWKSSPLLREFRVFVQRYYQDNIIEQQYLERLRIITSEYRNKSAHPYIIGLDQAKEFRVLMKECLVEFFDSSKP